jgi:hypothetical protein
VTCDVAPWRENHVWANARKAVLERDGDRCAWPKCYRSGGEVNHITPRYGVKLTTVGCLHHLDGLESLCGPHHKRVTKWEQRMRRGLPLFKYPDDGWLPGETVDIGDIARLLDMSYANASIQTPMYHFPEPIDGMKPRRGERVLGRRWRTVDVVAWACMKGFLDDFDLHPALMAMLVAENEQAAA